MEADDNGAVTCAPEVNARLTEWKSRSSMMEATWLVIATSAILPFQGMAKEPQIPRYGGLSHSRLSTGQSYLAYSAKI